jgi:branched-chain amino acid transport system substrate-binding protein
VTVVLVSGLALVSAPAHAADAATTTPVVGVTRTTVTVAGVVGGEATAVGADVGAQARFNRANRSGGVAGRTIEYRTTTTGSASELAGSVFAVVPAVSDALDTTGLAQARVPFVGAASTTGWDGNTTGFGFVGAQAVLQTRVVSPAWGAQLRSLLGTAQGSEVTVAVDDDALGTARAEQARRSLRAARFRVGATVVLPAPPTPLPDLAPATTTLTAGSPAVALLLTSPATTTALAQRLTSAGFTGTVATTDAFYQPASPAVANGMTVLVPYAPFEQKTAANRRVAADVDAFAPGTRLTPGVAAGYWSADAFLRMLARVGRRLTRPRFLAAANRNFSFSVPDTVGRSTWPAMHTRGVPCGALVQSDGSHYFVVEPYACGAPIVGTSTTKPTTKR